MLLTITSTAAPATDLGYLLHKNPAAAQRFELSFGTAHVFYPEADERRCTAALLLEIDPVTLVRGRGEGSEGLLDQYVNDRPYAASSFLAVAIAQVFGSALGGRSKDRPELAAAALPLVARIVPLPCRGGAELLRRLFEPLGWSVQAQGRELDAGFPEWGESPYLDVTLTGTRRLAELLNHLYVLVPVLDDEKHYWVGEDELEKLLRHGEGWLAAHPERELIARRYLKHRRDLYREALGRLTADEEGDPDERQELRDADEAQLERPLSLDELRRAAVIEVLRERGAHSVLDLGCGEGKLLAALLGDASVARLVGLDVSHRSLQIARERLKLERRPESVASRLTLLHGSLTYRDRRLEGFDAAAVVEVVEHLEPARLPAFERVLFEFARPGTIVVTTPNAEYNALFPRLPAGRLRHRDHRFEWTREEFREWAGGVGTRRGYAVSFRPVGPEHAALGSPTQMAVFTRG
jgi:3' terminal RNA ribose 2'-O-methyltransferase Hen1